MAREGTDAKIIPFDESKLILEEVKEKLGIFKEMGNREVSGQLVATLSICRKLKG